MEKEIIKYCNEFSIEDDIQSIENSIRINMGLDGDDAYFFLKSFEKKFSTNLLSRLDFEKYFHNEYELFKAKGFFKIKEIRNIEKELKISDLIIIGQISLD